VSFAETLAQDRRRAVLLLLSTADGFALNEDVLARELARIRLGVVTRDELRGLLAWLERQGLVSIERLTAPAVEGELWAAAATRAGRDVARGASHPGVAAPL
jgi:intein/homing endonuclease